MRTNAAFWDSSALLPLCCSQAFSARANKERRRFPKTAVWWGTTVEIHSAIARLIREGSITEKQNLLCRRRWSDIHRVAKKIEPTVGLLDLATDLLDTYPLRAMDAFQLAAALMWCGERPRKRPFITVDNRLSQAANEAGFEVLSLA